MIHFAIRSKSIRAGDRPFTCPGLGDRVHSVLLAYLYSEQKPVTIHLTDDKWSVAGGVLSDKKPKSWKEIVELFPTQIKLKSHPVENLTESQWLAFLSKKGYQATTYYYKDALSMHPNDFPIGIDASAYLANLPRLKAEPLPIQVPEKYITAQFDTTDRGRAITPLIQAAILNNYRSQGYEVVTLTGQMSLKEIAWYLYNTTYHVGVDSGMMHMAMLYLPYNRIHLYNRGFKSHHLIRAVQNGSLLNKDFTL